MSKHTLHAMRLLNGTTEDWHAPLVKQLNTANGLVISEEVKLAITKLSELLEKTDECIQSVTVSKQVPLGIDFEVIRKKFLDESMEVPDSIQLNTDIVSVTKTLRGSKNFAEKNTAHLLQKAIEAGVNDLKYRLDKLFT